MIKNSLQIKTLPNTGRIFTYNQCVLKTSIKKVKKFKVTEYRKMGDYPIIDQGKELIAGFTSEKDEILDFAQPIIIFGDHTLSIKYVDFPFGRGADGIQIIIPDERVIFPKFFYYLLKSMKIRATNYERHFKYIKRKNFILPEISEQKRVAIKLDKQFSKFKEIKHEIHRQKEASDNIFEGFLKLLFDVDYIKLAKKVKLSLYTKKIGSGSTPNGGYTIYEKSGIPFIRSMNVLMNSFSKKELAFISSQIDQKMKGTKVEKNDALLNITGASIGRVCVVPDEICPANVNQHVSIIRLTDEIDPHFFSYYVSRKEFQNEIMAIQSGATRQALTKSLIENFEVPLLDRAYQDALVVKINKIQETINIIKNNIRKEVQAISQLSASILDKELKKYTI